MKWDTRIETNGQQEYSDTDNLTSFELNMPPYAYCLPRYSRMDGVFCNAPDEITKGRNGFISEFLSDEAGIFQTVPAITITLDRLKTSNGIHMVFNRHSGDYPSLVRMTWLKDDEVVKSQEYAPDGVTYFFKAKITLYNRIKIEFLKTSKPNRYLWISVLKNQLMTDAGGLKIVYDDIALGAKEDYKVSVSDVAHYVDLENIREGVGFPDYAMCLPRYAKMDGDYANAPEELGDMGYISDSISDGNGIFDLPPTIIFQFSQNYSSVGITLTFNDHSGDFCSRIRVAWYRDDELLAEMEYEPDAADYFCYGVVDYYNKVVVSFLETNKPYRNVFLTRIIWGLIREFTDIEIKTIDCLMEVNPISEEVSVNTMNYSIRSQSEYAFEFQKRQKQTLYFNEAIMGIFYLQDGNQVSANRYEIETQDAVGVLDNQQFLGGIYTRKKVPDLFREIMDGEGIEYFLDDIYWESVISGYLPICNKRKALQQLAFAIGAVVDTSYDRQLYIYPQQTEVTGAFTANRIFPGLAIGHSDIITGVRIYAHNYSKGIQVAELFKGELNGEAVVEFSEPHFDLSTTGGIIMRSGVNYAVIRGTGAEVVLSGTKYEHSTIAIVKENPQITQNKNIVEVKDATLVTADSASDVLERVYSYCMNNEQVSFRGVIEDQELGSVVNVDTGFKGIKTGTITKLDFQFSRRKITAEVTIR